MESTGNLGALLIRMACAFVRPWITTTVIRTKNPEVDLKRAYPRVFGFSVVLSALAIGLGTWVIPELQTQTFPAVREPLIIMIEDIPETRQVKKLPPIEKPVPRMSVEGTARKDTVAKPEIDLDFLANLNVSDSDVRDIDWEEETVDFWAVSKEPKLIKDVVPVYPEMARLAGMEGVVFVKFAVGSDGQVKTASVLRGPNMFQQAALDAVYQFSFIPAMQNDRRVAVWMTLPIRFQLVDLPPDAPAVR